MASTLRQSNFHRARNPEAPEGSHPGITTFAFSDFCIDRSLEKLGVELLANLRFATSSIVLTSPELESALLPECILSQYLQIDSIQNLVNSETQRSKNLLENVFEEALKRIIMSFDRCKRDLFDVLESERNGLILDSATFQKEIDEYVTTSRRILRSLEVKSNGNIRDSTQGMKRTMEYGSYPKFDVQKESQDINRILTVINEMFTSSTIVALSKKISSRLQFFADDRSSTYIKNVTVKIDSILSDIKSSLDEISLREQPASDLKKEIVSPIPDYLMNYEKVNQGLTTSREANVLNQMTSSNHEISNFTTSAKKVTPQSQTEIDRQFSILEQNLNSINPRALANNSPTSRKDADAMKKSFFRSQNSITSGTINNLNDSRRELPNLPKESIKAFPPKLPIANSLPVPNVVTTSLSSSNNTDKKINKLATKINSVKQTHGSTRGNANEHANSASLVNKQTSFKHSFRTLTDFIPMQSVKESMRVGVSPRTSRQTSDRFSLSTAHAINSKPQSRANPLSSTNLDFSHSLAEGDEPRSDNLLISSSKTSIVSNLYLNPHRYSVSKIFSDGNSHITCIETNEFQNTIFAGNMKGELIKIQLDESYSEPSSVQKLWFNHPIKRLLALTSKYLLIEINAPEKSLFLIDTVAFGIVKHYQIPAERIKSIAYFTSDFFFVMSEANKIYLFSLNSSTPKRTFFVSGPVITNCIMSSPSAIFVSNTADEVKLLKFSPESLSIDLLVN
jgi:hypothetical protein